MPSTFSDFFTVHILNEENITKIFFLHSCDKAIKASSWQSWQRDSTVLHSLNASIFYTYLPKTSLDSRKKTMPQIKGNHIGCQIGNHLRGIGIRNDPKSENQKLKYDVFML